MRGTFERMQEYKNEMKNKIQGTLVEKLESAYWECVEIQTLDAKELCKRLKECVLIAKAVEYDVSRMKEAKE